MVSQNFGTAKKIEISLTAAYTWSKFRDASARDTFTSPQTGIFFLEKWHFSKKKAPCLQRDRVRKNTLRYHSRCLPLAGKATHSLHPQADPVTKVNRPRLLASSFSRRLQGDFQTPSLTALPPKRAALCAGGGVLLVLFHAGYSIVHYTIPGFLNLSR